MPDVINRYAICTDLYRVNVQPATTLSITGPAPADLVNLTYSAAKDTYTAGTYTVEKVHSNDAAYHLQLNIYTGGQLLGFMLTDRTKKYGVSKNLRPLHVTNEAFYTLNHGGELAGFLQAFGLEVANSSQLDICLYTQQIDPAKLIQRLTGKTGKYQRIMRRNDKHETVIGARDERTGKIFNTTYFGKDSETVTVKIYDKSFKLASQPKQYVSDWHLANGFDPSKPVYSVEVSIKARALKEYRYNNAVSNTGKQTEATSYCIDLQRLNSPAYLAQLFQHFWPLDIRKKDATRPQNCTRVSLIDYTIHGEAELNKTVELRPTTSTLTMEKNVIKYHVAEFAHTGESIHLDMARAVAQRHQLTETLAKQLAKFTPASSALPAPTEAQQVAA
ncbi:hypothetical protein GCM10011495_28740 [Hymenobacter frigidus]|uniref:Uncharacterized protein n=1 Tax=Hymenobacter frigidus TaxID=1524095 RepID=A0ABQ2A8I1_9BACT|nr:hypothetical protein [Hymenobacter frigidus]GGH88148.1 hypothetical protein GCM10011495_28740 [Hymenobacter frigidus]